MTKTGRRRRRRAAAASRQWQWRRIVDETRPLTDSAGLAAVEMAARSQTALLRLLLGIQQQQQQLADASCQSLYSPASNRVGAAAAGNTRR